jgi:hypothetical protein
MRPLDEIITRTAVACFWANIGWQRLLAMPEPADFLQREAQLNPDELGAAFAEIRRRLNAATLREIDMQQEPGHA